MVKNTDFRGLKEEDDIELDLGLSVGGSYSRQNDVGLRSEKSIGPAGSSIIRSTISSSFDDDHQMMMTKKEIHALRRQEAKKKQLLKRGFCRPILFNGGQIDEDHRECKKIKKEEIINGSDSNHKIGSCYAAPPCNPSPENGFMYPCANVMPCWFSGGGAAAVTTEEKQMVQILPVVGYGFVPLDLDHSSGNGYGSEENRKSGSNGSNNCTSSTGSDHRSSCNEGGGSNNSYTISHSSPPVPQQPQMNGPKASNDNNDAKSHSEHTAISNISESASVNEATTTTNTTSNPTQAENKPYYYKPPPKPEQTTPPPLPYMPCVSTTGNGPNGKTVNGFLYRYTKTEVSIICVCHGSSFTPAEFVQHAGGTDVLHPLRHITVVPSAF